MCACGGPVLLCGQGPPKPTITKSNPAAPCRRSSDTRAVSCPWRPVETPHCGLQRLGRAACLLQPDFLAEGQGPGPSHSGTLAKTPSCLWSFPPQSAGTPHSLCFFPLHDTHIVRHWLSCSFRCFYWRDLAFCMREDSWVWSPVRLRLHCDSRPFTASH